MENNKNIERYEELMARIGKLTEDQAIEIITENSCCVLSSDEEKRKWVDAIDMAVAALRLQKASRSRLHYGRMGKRMDNKKYAWTRNAEDEIWKSATFDSVKECIEDARGCGIKPGERIVVGICEPYEPQIDAERILDSISEDAYEQVGEVAEGWPYFKSGEGYEGAATLQERMQKVFMEWLEETGQIPTFYHIHPLADLVTVTEE